MLSNRQPEWVLLQKKIFSRWVQQKLIRRHIPCEDILKDIDAQLLVNLVEVLSENKYPGKALKTTTSRVGKIDNVSSSYKNLYQLY